MTHWAADWPPEVGNGWKLVRRVGMTNGTWHPARDNLLGTAQYGEPCDYWEECTFSIPFHQYRFKEFMFATGTFLQWIIIESAPIQQFHFPGPFDTKVIMSSAQKHPYMATFVNREEINFPT